MRLHFMRNGTNGDSSRNHFAAQLVLLLLLGCGLTDSLAARRQIGIPQFVVVIQATNGSSNSIQTSIRQPEQ